MSFVTPGPLLEITTSADRTVARLIGCKGLDDASAEVVARQLSSLVDGREGQHLVIDLALVGYLTSTALSKLITLNRRLRQGGGRLTVTNVSPAVREIFTVTCLDRILEVQPAVDEVADSGTLSA